MNLFSFKKGFLYFCVFIFINTNLFALDIDKSKSKVAFKASKLVFVGVDGEFKDYEGNVSILNDEIVALNGNVFVNSVESGNKTRDEHIRGEVLFDSKKYPIISFKMSKYEALSSANGISKGKIYGLMNAHGVSKDIVFDSTVKKTEEGYILTLNSIVDVKKDFNMQSYSIMSNSVDIDVSLCFWFKTIHYDFQA